MTETFHFSNYKGSTGEMLEAAAADLRNNPGSRLMIPPGVYIYSHPRATEIMNEIFDGVHGENPESVMFSPDFVAPVALDLTGCKDVTVIAYNVKLLIDGFAEPVRIKNAENVTLKGLTVDHVRKPFSFATVTSLTEGGAILEFDKTTPPTVNMTTPRSFVYELDKDRITTRGRGWLRGERTMLSPLRVKHEGAYTPEDVGNRIYFSHTFHARPGILISHSVNTALEDVTLYSQPGMGIVGFKSRDITVKRLKIVPSPGLEMSVNTDATHFSSCSGTVTVEDSEFCGHTDDAINVHNYYYSVSDANGAECSVKTVTSATHSAEVDLPEVGHRLALVRKEDLVTVENYTVVKIDKDSPSRITLDKEFSFDPSRYFFANMTDVAAIVFRRCNVHNHLSRSVLCKTHNAVIEDNTFFRCSGTAVHIATEGAWGEGIPTENITVRNNRFIHCGEFGRGQIMDTSAICVNASNECEIDEVLHKNIVIENNEIIGSSEPKYAVLVRGTDTVTVRNNRFDGVTVPIRIDCSVNVDVSDNTDLTGSAVTAEYYDKK